MDSKDFGLEFMHTVTGLEHLHYGFWDKKTKPALMKFPAAQEKYTNMLLDLIRKRGQKMKGKMGEQMKGKVKSPSKSQPLRILDVGCGSGTTLCRLLEQGYKVDGIVPSDYLYAAAKEKLKATLKLNKKAKHAKESKIFKCIFEEILQQKPLRKYDIVLFSESFQYIKFNDSYSILRQLLNPAGEIIIADFFRISQAKDPSSFGGGHFLPNFYNRTKDERFRIISDKDITANMLPNIELLDSMLMHRGLPALQLLNSFLLFRHNIIYKMVKFLFRRIFARIKHKYFSGNRNAKNFAKYKSYRIMVLAPGK